MDSLPRFAWSRMTLFKTSFLSRRTTDGIHTHHPGGILRFSQLKKYNAGYGFPSALRLVENDALCTSGLS